VSVKVIVKGKAVTGDTCVRRCQSDTVVSALGSAQRGRVLNASELRGGESRLLESYGLAVPVEKHCQRHCPLIR